MQTPRASDCSARVVEVAQPSVLDRFECGVLCFTQRPNLFVLIQVLLDHLSDCHTLAVRTLDGTRFRQLRLTALYPGLSDLLAVEGLAFLINCAPVPIDPYLRRLGSRVVLALA